MPNHVHNAIWYAFAPEKTASSGIIQHQLPANELTGDIIKAPPQQFNS
ncbi:hypothetical protein BN8_00513 [Fibrisoma limi BUZ 3]|uniref:Uncharacterized protein n=1 Tax=Fibrisoma limi BUZ 3 TaxID=1185876 RepID=I2GCF9_9BACT|nr:hypothetical protein BN8_00513 [Fibrisoma limi BUZ 3]